MKAVPKPTGRRERAVVCLAPAQVEAIRASLIDSNKLFAATLVSLVAYQGLRVPEEVLALEVRHVRANTLLIEQRNIKRRIAGGQKVRRFRPRAIDWALPRQDGEPWKVHDYKNWTRRVWHKARKGASVDRLPPYELRHAFASLQIRAGLSIPELAEQLAHSPPMTLGTYAHVIRELKGEPRVSAEEQIDQARRGISGFSGSAADDRPGASVGR